MDVGQGNVKRYAQFIFFEAKKYSQCLGENNLTLMLVDNALILSCSM